MNNPSKMIQIKRIVMDKKIQPRVALSQDTINEYCEAHINGDDFPNIVVFLVNNKYYLADGWHRLEAAKKAKITEMTCDVIKGTYRDAIKYSLLANSKHGLNRSHADKRKAVQACIDDPEWSVQSARVIGNMCGVSHTFVNSIYKEKAEQAARDNKGGNVSTSESEDDDNKEKNDGPQSEKSSFDTDDDKKTTSKKKVDTHESGLPVIPEGMILVDEHSYNEDMFNYKQVLDENASIQKMIESDEPIKEANDQIRKLNIELTNTKSRMKGIIDEKNQALSIVKSHKAVITKQAKLLKAAGVTETI